MIGKSKETLLKCAGVPDKTFDQDEMTFYSFSSETQSTRGGSIGFSGKKNSVGVSAFSSDSYNCIATVEVKDGKVINVSYRASSSGPSDLCSSIFEPCFTGSADVGEQMAHAEAPEGGTTAEVDVSSGPVLSRRHESGLSGEQLYVQMLKARRAGATQATNFIYGLFEVEARRIEEYILRSKGSIDEKTKTFTLDPSLTSDEATTVRWFMPIFSAYHVY